MMSKELACWIDQLENRGQFERIFDHIPGVLFFVKDLNARSMMCNQAFVEHLGFQHKSQIFGKSDSEYLPYYMVEKYREDDLLVAETKTPLLNIIELFPTKNKLPELYLTHKFPVFDKQHTVCGICGTLTKLDNPWYPFPPYQELAPVLHYIRIHYAETIPIDQLAALKNVSIRQLQRQFKAVMRCTPREYIIKFRILRAADQLANTRLSISEISLSNGFYDHSSFVRHFKKQMNQTPSDYRKAHRHDTFQTAQLGVIPVNPN